MSLNWEGVYMSKEMVSLKKPAAIKGKIEIVRASALAEAGTTGTVAEGILEKVEPNKFNKDKNDYFIRGEDGTLYILNETQALKEQLGQPGILGLHVRVDYDGKQKTKNGKGYHSFNVFAEKASK
jgi:hypothetical protein